MKPVGLSWLMAGILVGASACGSTSSPAYETVIASLDEPRGLLLHGDSALCVVEAGTTGESLAAAPEYQNNSGAVTCFETGSARRQIATGLPYANNRFSGVSVGATDLVEMGGQLYLLVGEGFDDTSRTILRLDEAGGPPAVVADFLAYARATTAPNFFDEIIITSNPFALLADSPNQRFLVTDGASGEVLSAGIDGTIEVYSAVEGHEVLTGLAVDADGRLFVASFSRLPHTAGSGSILRIDADGGFEVVLRGLTTPIDLGFDSSGRMYVLEFVDAADPVRPYEGESGRLLQFEQTGDSWTEAQVLVDQLAHPTSMLIDPGDNIYISVNGAFSDPQSGLVLRIERTTGR